MVAKHSFAELLNRHRSNDKATPQHATPHQLPPQWPAVPSPKTTSRDRPWSSHSSIRTLDALVEGASRSTAGSRHHSRQSSLRSVDRTASLTQLSERRISDLSVVTQIHVPSPKSPSTPTQATHHQFPTRTSSRFAPFTKDSPGILQSPKSQRNSAQKVPLSVPFRDSHPRVTVRPDESAQDKPDDCEEELVNQSIGDRGRASLANEVLAEMLMSESDEFHDAMPYVDQTQTSSSPTDHVQQKNMTPSLPPRSPSRKDEIIVKPPPRSARHARNSSSIDRLAHNNSVASSSHLTESEQATANSDVFSQDDTEDSYASDISSVGGDDEASEPESYRHQSRKRMSRLNPQSNGRRNRQSSTPSKLSNNQHLPAAPSASAIYDMLDIPVVSDTAFTDSTARSIHSATSGLSSTSSLRSSSLRNEAPTPDLSRRPPSPMLSDISDAESFDSAIPPPVSLTRDSEGPRYRSVAEQKQGPLSVFKQPLPSPSRFSHKSTPSLRLNKSKSSTWTSAGKTSFAASADGRNGSYAPVTPTMSRAPSRADSMPALSLAASQQMRSASVANQKPVTHTKTFNLSLPSFSSMFKGFSRKNRAKKEVPESLPALRKITFDRGQKRVLELNVANFSDLDLHEMPDRGHDEQQRSGIDDDDELAPYEDNVATLAAPPAPLYERKESLEMRRSISSLAMRTNMGANQPQQAGWRNREKGAPRRTAWR